MEDFRRGLLLLSQGLLFSTELFPATAGVKVGSNLPRFDTSGD